MKKRGTVQLLVFNGSLAPFDFGSEIVTAKLSDGTLVPIISPTQMAREGKGRSWWRNFGTRAAMAGRMLDADSAENSSGIINYRGTSTSPYGSAQTTGTATFSQHNPAQEQAARSLANIENQ